jgi:hypothetical protein
LNVLVVPDRNPQKSGPLRDQPFNHYLELVNRFGPEVGVFPGFMSLERNNPTASWIHSISRTRDLWLILGDDGFQGLNDWLCVHSFLGDLTGLFVVPRGRSDVAFQTQKTALQKAFPSLKVVRSEHHPFEGLSSTELRDSL